MNIRNKLLFYAITDREGQPEARFLADIEKALQAGITLLQLREKGKATEEIITIGGRVKELADNFQVPLIIDDDVLAAKALDAAGVHLGRQDMPISEARAILGANKIIGATAKTVEQALEAEAQGADYLGCGRIFTSRTKEAAEGMSIGLLQEICKSVKIPVCAIGGIESGNIHKFAGSGIAGIAISKGLFAAEEIFSEAEKIKRELAKI